jgi:hypothetical protein
MVSINPVSDRSQQQYDQDMNDIIELVYRVAEEHTPAEVEIDGHTVEITFENDSILFTTTILTLSPESEQITYQRLIKTAKTLTAITTKAHSTVYLNKSQYSLMAFQRLSLLDISNNTVTTVFDSLIHEIEYLQTVDASLGQQNETLPSSSSLLVYQ